jgi:hypothetical protein
VALDDLPQRQPATAEGDVRTAISDGLVALLKEYYGRGSEQAKTYVSEDLVVCLLRGGFRGRLRRRCDPPAHGVPGSYASTLRASRRTGHGPPRRRLHVRQPAGPGHDLRSVRARTQRAHALTPGCPAEAGASAPSRRPTGSVIIARSDRGSRCREDGCDGTRKGRCADERNRPIFDPPAPCE